MSLDTVKLEYSLTSSIIQSVVLYNSLYNSLSTQSMSNVKHERDTDEYYNYLPGN